MKAAIRQRARELGFDDCRFTTAAPPFHAAQFQCWLDGNRHGEMTWLERNADKRLDLQQVLPGAKSVVCLAASYAQRQLTNSKSEIRNPKEVRNPKLEPVLPAQAAVDPRIAQTARTSDCRSPSSFEFRVSSSAPSGLIARYARFQDYHHILATHLKLLSDFVNQVGGTGTRSLGYVDTGPVLERDLAQRAGVGFAGKHTNLISRQLGNWFFLAEILTTLELVPDAPEPNRCGSCTRCLAACPTAAITAPFQLDARRCISYLTIELKGAIPLERRHDIGNRIYGCDDCLAVCPWNRFAREGSLMKAQARPDIAMPDLLELLALDEAGFEARFARTPILRTRRRGLLRNVCVALGNVGDATVLPALQKAAVDPEPLIAEHARWAIGRVQACTAAG
jgi:epoxyqueuosine reductase